MDAGQTGGCGTGDHTRTVQAGELELRFVVRVPPRHDESKRAPVVIVYHGGGNPENVIRLTETEVKSDASGFVALDPQGTGPLRVGMLTFNGLSMPMT